MSVEINETHHAGLFIAIADTVGKLLDQANTEQALKDIVCNYGFRRGARMAATVKENNGAENICSYVAYCEYKNTKNAMKQEILKIEEGSKILISQCPWYDTWKKYNKMDYGKIYCNNIDESLFKGFGKTVKISVDKVKPRGDASCTFIYHDFYMNLSTIAKIGFMKAINPGKKIIKSWAFHVADLLDSASNSMEQLGIKKEIFEDQVFSSYSEMFTEEISTCINKELQKLRLSTVSS